MVATPDNAFSEAVHVFGLPLKSIFRGGWHTATAPENPLSATVFLTKPPLKIPLSETDFLT